jgi:hypothetical protein
MAVTSEQVRVSYAGNDVTVAFAVPFMFHDNAALLVIERSALGVETVKVLNTHYTITGEDVITGGTVTMTTAPAAGVTLFIIHDPDLTQVLDLVGGTSLPAESLEAELDRQVHQNQRTRELATRTPRLAETDTDGSGAYNANSNRIANLADPTSGQDAVTRAYALANFATASGPAALPPNGSLTNAMWDTAGDLALTNVDGLTIAEQQVEVNPLALADSGDLLAQLQKIQFQILAILNNLDAGARAHAYEAVGTNVPTQITASIAAAVVGGNELVNGSLLVSQRFPSETATGTNTGFDAYVCDEWFVYPTGGVVTWRRTAVAADLHSAARSPLGLEFDGAAGMTNMRFGTRLGRSKVRRLGALLANKNVTFGIKVKHSGTTGSITPDFHVRSTSNTGPDEANATKFAVANMTNRLTQPFPGALASGNEVAFTHTFDLGAMVDSQNGVELYVDFLAMNLATIQFTVVDAWLAFGDITATLLVDDFDEALDACLLGFQKTPGYSVSVATLNAGTAGFGGTLIGHGKDGTAISGMHWNHARPLRFAGTFATYNPAVGSNNAPRNQLGENGLISTVAAGQSTSYVRYDTGGTDSVAWHVHATHDASWYD